MGSRSVPRTRVPGGVRLCGWPGTQSGQGASLTAVVSSNAPRRVMWSAARPLCLLLGLRIALAWTRRGRLFSPDCGHTRWDFGRGELKEGGKKKGRSSQHGSTETCSSIPVRGDTSPAFLLSCLLHCITGITGDGRCGSAVGEPLARSSPGVYIYMYMYVYIYTCISIYI